MTKSSFKPKYLILGITTVSTIFYISTFNSNDIDPKIKNNIQSSTLIHESSNNLTNKIVKTTNLSGRLKSRNVSYSVEDNNTPEEQHNVDSIPVEPQNNFNVIHQSKTQAEWERERFSKRQDESAAWEPIPDAKGRLKLPFPPPPNFIENKEDSISSIDLILNSAAHFFLPTAAHASAGQFGNIVLDGNLSDWSIDDRINLPLDRPPYIATENELYGKYIASPTPTYVFALKSTESTLEANTTLWLNTDLNATTGYLVWGLHSGAEFFINIYSGDSSPHLYNKDFGWVSSLTHAFSSDRRIVEIAIPASSLQLGASAQSIEVLGDINDSTLLFPVDFSSGGQFTLVGSHPSLPPRTDSSKRVAIIYGDTTKNNFFGKKAYSQLFMSIQHQAMMAGVSYDLLSENDLTDINNLVNYDALIFPFFSDIPSDKLKQIHDTLFKAVYNYGIGIITADDWMSNTETGTSISGDAYRNMKQLLGIGRVSGNGPVNVNLTAQYTSHSIMEGYSSNELIRSYKKSWYSIFQSIPGQPSASIAKQSVSGSSAGRYPAVIATTTGGRNVHFATLSYMADTNLLWQAIQWVLYGNEPSVGLKMGRTNNLFVSRNDMDISSEHDQVSIVHVPLLNLLTTWKNDYNFVGSFFINIGNDPANGFWTDWNISAPLFSNYIKLDNEIGTHSWTHPHSTDLLSSSDIEFEFNQSMNKIGTQLNHTTWQ